MIFKMFTWLCLLFLISFSLVDSELIDTDNFKIWGPGLNPSDVVMPARYFFIDTGLNKSINPLPFELSIFGTNKNNIRCKIWHNILDRKDGSYIIRYKVYETCFHFIITVAYKNKHIGDSPYQSDRPVFVEECNCPQESFEKWSKSFRCDPSYVQMENDLKIFDQVDFNSYRPKILEIYNKPTTYSLCNYVIKNNQIYRQCYGKYVGFKMFMDSILLSLARKVRLPDVEMFVNLGDWPLSLKNKDPLPIFSWCGSEDSYDIVMPTYDITESSLENMGRVMLDMLSVQGNIGKRWDEKIPQMFWRGRDSNRRRLELIEISRKYPDLFNVSLTNFFFYQNEQDKYGPKTEHVSFFKFFDYKYQINIDGTVAAYRFPYLLAGDSLVFKQDSKYYEWFYHLLEPNKHYVGIKEDLSNLINRLKWAIKNDDKALKIARAGQEFTRKYLMPEHVFCYYAVLLSKWSEKIKSDVVVYDGMELVNQPNISCECPTKVKDEL